MDIFKAKEIEVMEIRSVDEILGFLKASLESIPTAPDIPGVPGPFLPHDFHIFDKVSNNFIVQISNGLLIKKDGKLIGIGSRPTVYEVLDTIDVMTDKTSDSLPPSDPEKPSFPTKLDWIRYRADIWKWLDENRGSPMTDEQLNSMPTQPKSTLPQ